MKRFWDRMKAWWYGWERVSGLEPSTSLRCEWCHEVGPTTVSSVWSKAFPEGRRVRLCSQCASMCGGG